MRQTGQTVRKLRDEYSAGLVFGMIGHGGTSKDIRETKSCRCPTRSTGPALFVGGWALGPLWLFWLAPIAGAAAAGLAGRWLFEHEEEDRSPGPIFDKPVEVLVQESNEGRSEV